MFNLEIYSTALQYFSVIDKLPSYIKPLGLGNHNFPKHWLAETNGENIADLNKYFSRALLSMIIKKPFETINNNNFSVNVSVKGGGLSGQANAVKLAISKALVNYDSKFRVALKKEGLLTRDSRVVERKKYGRRKARRSFQFSKR